MPNEPAGEELQQHTYFEDHGSPLWWITPTWKRSSRDVLLSKTRTGWLWSLYWAIWPFETLLLPRRHVLRLPNLSDSEKDALARILKRLLTKYDNLFEVSFPYFMG